jgi:hypothetical protein
MDLRIVLVLALGLAGCASETVFLENAQGERVQCGPYAGGGNAMLAQNSLRNCIEDFQRTGYERVQGPQ